MKRLHAWLRWRSILLLAALTPPCRQITVRCSRKIDGAHSWNAWWQLPLHLAICAGCRRYLHQLEALHKIASHYQPPTSASNPEVEARQDRLRRRLRAERIPPPAG